MERRLDINAPLYWTYYIHFPGDYKNRAGTVRRMSTAMPKGGHADPSSFGEAGQVMKNKKGGCHPLADGSHPDWIPGTGLVDD
jgi:hypothetical protein